MGLYLRLGLSTLKVQVAAISSATQKRWAEDLLIVKCFKTVRKIHPKIKLYFPKWDLTLVLEVLSEQPFEPFRRGFIVEFDSKVGFSDSNNAMQKSLRVASLRGRRRP